MCQSVRAAGSERLTRRAKRARCNDADPGPFFFEDRQPDSIGLIDSLASVQLGYDVKNSSLFTGG